MPQSDPHRPLVTGLLTIAVLLLYSLHERLPPPHSADGPAVHSPWNPPAGVEPSFGPNTLEGSIEIPSGPVVRSPFPVDVQHSGVDGGARLWVAVRIGGQRWFKEPVVPRRAGRWSLRISEAGRPDEFAVELWLVSTETDVAIQRWLRDGVRSGSFPGWATVPAGVRLDVVDGLRLR